MVEDKMALDDLKMEKLPEERRLSLPEISKGDAVLVYAHSGRDKRPEIFCSDGMVAQSDVIIDNDQFDRHKHMGEISVEELLHYVPEIVVKELKHYPEDSPRHAGFLYSAQINYGHRVIVGEAIRRGYLQDLVEQFGREEGAAIAHELDILHSPIVIFGYDPTQVYDVVISAGQLNTRANFFQQQNPYENLDVSINDNSDTTVWYQLKDVERVIVGKEAILSELRNSPLEITLEQHYCKPLKLD